MDAHGRRTGYQSYIPSVCMAGLYHNVTAEARATACV